MGMSEVIASPEVPAVDAMNAMGVRVGGSSVRELSVAEAGKVTSKMRRDHQPVISYPARHGRVS